MGQRRGGREVGGADKRERTVCRRVPDDGGGGGVVADSQKKAETLPV